MWLSPSSAPAKAPAPALDEGEARAWPSPEQQESALSEHLYLVMDGVGEQLLPQQSHPTWLTGKNKT